MSLGFNLKYPSLKKKKKKMTMGKRDDQNDKTLTITETCLMHTNGLLHYFLLFFLTFQNDPK